MILNHPENGKPLRGAIIGFGNAAMHAHLPIWRNNSQFTIAAVVEPHAGRARMAGALLPEARIHATMEDMLHEGGIDFVDICTPPCFHDRFALAACRLGLHVFCEKPLATSTDRLWELQETAAKSGKVVFTVNNWKYAPLWVKARELIQENRIGSVRSISMNVLRTSSAGGGASDWRTDPELARGGIMIDHGWHNLYLILSLVQAPPLSVSARMESSSGNGSSLEETVDLLIRFQCAEAHLHLTWLAPCRRNFGTVVGEHGALAINDDHILLDPGTSPPVRFDFPQALSAASHHPEWMDCVVDDFSREIFNILQRGSNFMEARWCTHLIESAYRSNREGACAVEV